MPPPMRHAAELMPAVRSLVRDAGWRADEIEEIYLSLGPGSFTGLRIAVAAVRAMVQAIELAGRRCHIVGVPSLDVIARNAPPEYPVVVPDLDAKRGQVFAARYERDVSGDHRRCRDAQLVDPRAFLADAARLAAARGGRVALLGEGVHYHREELSMAGENVAVLDPSLWYGRAREVHQLGLAAALAGVFANPETLLPLYIRLPEAEEVWQKKQGIVG